MAARNHHTALKSETVSKINAGHIEIALAKLQWGKDEVAYTLHVNPSSYTTAGLQTTDWLAYLGFQRNDRCQFTSSHCCYSKEVAAGFDQQEFAVAFNEGFEAPGSWRIGLNLTASNVSRVAAIGQLAKPPKSGAPFGQATRRPRTGFGRKLP